MSKQNIQEVNLKGGNYDKKKTIIIISNLPDNAKELAMELSGLLSSVVGPVEYMEFRTDYYSNHIQENFAECRFVDEAGVSSALTKIHGLLWHNYHLIAQLKEDYLSQQHHTSEHAVLVRSLPPHFSNEDAWRLFGNCGKLGFLKIFRDTSYHALECIVNFYNKQSVTKALQRNNAEYLDGPIKVLKINSDTLVAVPVPSRLLLDLALILEEIRKMECFIHACVENYGDSNQEHIFLYCLNENVSSNLLSCQEFGIFGEMFSVIQVCRKRKTSEQIAVTSMQRPETFGQSSEASGQFPETSEQRSNSLKLRSGTSEMKPGRSGLRSEISGQRLETSGQSADTLELSSKTSRVSSRHNPPRQKHKPSNQKLKPPETRNQKPCVYVLDVPSDATESDLLALFGEATVELSYRTNITRLVFKTKGEAERACRRSIRTLKGVRVTVCDTLQQASAIFLAWKKLSPAQLSSARYLAPAQRKRKNKGHRLNLTQTKRNEQDSGHQLNLTQTQRNEQDIDCQLNLTKTQRNDQDSGRQLNLTQPGCQLNLTQPNETVTYGGFTAAKIIADFYHHMNREKKRRKMQVCDKR